jgi:FkbM family methyltransferase
MRLPPAVRRVLDPITTRLRVPILSGVNRGLRWSLASAGHGYATGTRAASQMGMLAALMRPGDVVWDVGAHHGYVTLCAARRVGHAGQVHAFEPNATNRERLRRHVAWNALPNVEVHGDALADYEGEASFGGGGTSKTLALGRGAERVRVTTGAALIAQGACPVPDLVKVDVEGAEGAMLEGALPAFEGRARLVIGVHSRAAHEACVRALAAFGYALRPSRALAAAVAATDAPWPGDPDLYAAGPRTTRRAEDEGVLEQFGF